MTLKKKMFNRKKKKVEEVNQPIKKIREELMPSWNPHRGFNIYWGTGKIEDATSVFSEHIDTSKSFNIALPRESATAFSEQLQHTLTLVHNDNKIDPEEVTIFITFGGENKDSEDS